MTSYQNQAALNSTKRDNGYSHTKANIRSICDSNCRSCSEKMICPFANSEVETFSSLREKLDKKKLNNILDYSTRGQNKEINYSGNLGFSSPSRNFGFNLGYQSSQNGYNNLNGYNSPANRGSYEKNTTGLSYSINSFNPSGLGYSQEGGYAMKSGGCSSCESYGSIKGSSKGKGKY